jgi:hypothetical protein
MVFKSGAIFAGSYPGWLKKGNFYLAGQLIPFFVFGFFLVKLPGIPDG